MGFLLTALYWKGGSLIPGILAHGILNALSVFAVEPSRTFHMVVSAVLCLVALAYGLYLWNGKEADHGTDQ